MNGIDWAYSVLVDIALMHGKEHMKSRAMQFTRDTLNACVGMACGDIDFHTNAEEGRVYAYEMVRDVCMELTQ